MMQEEFFRFWDDPLTWIRAQADEHDITLEQLFEEANFEASLWRRWQRGECQPTFRTFRPIIRAVERRQAMAEVEKRNQARRKLARRAARQQ